MALLFLALLFSLLISSLFGTILEKLSDVGLFYLSYTHAPQNLEGWELTFSFFCVTGFYGCLTSFSLTPPYQCLPSDIEDLSAVSTPKLPPVVLQSRMSSLSPFSSKVILFIQDFQSSSMLPSHFPTTSNQGRALCCPKDHTTATNLI